MSRFQKIVTRYSDGMPNAAPDVVSDIQFLLGAYNACCDALDDQRSEVRKLTVQRDALRADAAQQAADAASVLATAARVKANILRIPPVVGREYLNRRRVVTLLEDLPTEQEPEALTAATAAARGKE